MTPSDGEEAAEKREGGPRGVANSTLNRRKGGVSVMGRAPGIAKTIRSLFAIEGRVPGGALVVSTLLVAGRREWPLRARIARYGFSRQFAPNSRRDHGRKIVDDEISSAFSSEVISVTPYVAICYQIPPVWHAAC